MRNESNVVISEARVNQDILFFLKPSSEAKVITAHSFHDAIFESEAQDVCLNFIRIHDNTVDFPKFLS